MASWLTDLNEARKKPLRTLVSLMGTGFVGLALADYFLADTHSVASACAAGGIAAVVIGLVISRGLWPSIFDRPLTAHGPHRLVRYIGQWYYLLISLFISLTLFGFGISTGRADVAVAGIPFLLIGVVITFAKKMSRGRQENGPTPGQRKSLRP